MTFNRKILGAIAALFIWIQPALAGDCVITISREACPGKDAECYKKCNGVKTCDDKRSIASIEECAKAALKECEIARPGVTKAKSVTATYDGAAIDDGKQFCDANRPDFNKCD